MSGSGEARSAPWLSTLALPLVLPLLLAALAGCRREPAAPVALAHPVLVVGIDGAEWSVIRELWAQGRLPALRGIAERGTTATLRTAYAASPVIWTTIATGRLPRAHGITGFVAPTPQGDVPVSSTLRRVPALWNMASTAGRRVAVVSWWASWPAEPVRGVVLSDRALMELPERVWPAEFGERLASLQRRALARPNGFGGNPDASRRDQVTAEAAVELAGEGYDLMLVYFRSVDIASHLTWRHFRPAGFGPPDPVLAREVPRTYEATDAAIGRLLAAAPDANVLVISDHGFRRLREEQLRVTLPFEEVLARLGYLERDERGIRWPATRVYVWASHSTAPHQKLRFALAGRERGGSVLPAARAELQEALARDLARVTWADGRPAFRLRSPHPGEAREGADLVVAILAAGAGTRLLLDGEPWDGVVESVSRLSGSHNRNTHGVLLAAGPDIARGAKLDGIHIHDIAPTVLFALGLPVADDFAGKPRVELFGSALRARQPLRRIRTWGEPRSARATASEADAEIERELRSLGYLQ